MENIKRIVHFLIIILIIGSCKKDYDENARIYNEMIPTFPGNSWSYIKTNINDASTETFQKSIGSLLVIDNHRGFTFGDNLSIRTDENGNTVAVAAYTNSETVILESIIYKMDIDLNDSFNSKTFSIDESDNSIDVRDVVKTCIGKNEEVITPAGKFKCIVYQYNDGMGNVFNEYLSINKGIIKIEEYSIGTLTYTTELTDYTIN